MCVSRFARSSLNKQTGNNVPRLSIIIIQFKRRRQADHDSVSALSWVPGTHTHFIWMGNSSWKKQKTVTCIILMFASQDKTFTFILKASVILRWGNSTYPTDQHYTDIGTFTWHHFLLERYLPNNSSVLWEANKYRPKDVLWGCIVHD